MPVNYFYIHKWLPKMLEECSVYTVLRIRIIISHIPSMEIESKLGNLCSALVLCLFFDHFCFSFSKFYTYAL